MIIIVAFSFFYFIFDFESSSFCLQLDFIGLPTRKRYTPSIKKKSSDRTKVFFIRLTVFIFLSLSRAGLTKTTKIVYMTLYSNQTEWNSTHTHTHTLMRDNFRLVSKGIKIDRRILYRRELI